ncbi:MAG: hypothetical protein GXP48_05605 [Acidobacteria bacterium]|nr:hypothetical protein [Acidobacteriota bacterium]
MGKPKVGVLCLALVVYPLLLAAEPASQPSPSRTSPVSTVVRRINGVPVLLANGRPFVLKVWTAGLHLGSQDDATVKARMSWAAAHGFNAVEIMVQWRLIESTRGVYDWTRIDSLMDSAASYGLYVLLTIEAGVAPPWFADDLYPDAVFVTYDPNPAQHPISGRLAISGYGSLPIFYHPAYWKEADAFFTAAINRYKTHPALFGYDLCVFTTGEYNYPGGNTYGIAGFADYSSYTRRLFGRDPPIPLEEYSQPGPDTRPDWMAWSHFRIQKKREALDHFGMLIKSLDPDHVLVAWTGNSPLWGGWDNGLIAEAGGGDYPYLISRPYVDVIRGGPQLAPDLFRVVNGKLSMVPFVLVAMIQATQRHGKLFLLQTERVVNSEAPDVTGRITAWAEAFHSLGAQLLWWQEPQGEGVSGAWTSAERAELVSTLKLANRPLVERISRADLAFVDLGFETSKYYADDTLSLVSATSQVQAFLDAGLPFDTLSADEIMEEPAVLDRYKAVGLMIPRAYDLLAPAKLKAIIADFQARGGVVWRGDPEKGRKYAAGGYTDTTYLDALRAYYDSHGLTRHRYSGHDLQIWGNKPYIFILSRSTRFTGTLELSIKGWDLPDGPITLLEINSGEIYTARVVRSSLHLEITLARGKPYLLQLQGGPNRSVRRSSGRVMPAVTR